METFLQQGRDDVSRGEGGAILRLGESGMGKTHLVEVLRSMHERKLLGEGGHLCEERLVGPGLDPGHRDAVDRAPLRVLALAWCRWRS